MLCELSVGNLVVTFGILDVSSMRTDTQTSYSEVRVKHLLPWSAS